MEVSNDGKDCITEIFPIISKNGYTLLDINLITGRTHQIRLSLSEIDHPIIGDRKYGKRIVNENLYDKYGLRNQYLIAYKLKFGDMEKGLEYLNNKEFKIDNIYYGEIEKNYWVIFMNYKTIKEYVDQNYENPNNYFGAIIDNTVYSLNHSFYPNKKIELLKANTKDGFNILYRTMILTIQLALNRIYPNKLVSVEHFIGRGLYLEFSRGVQVNRKFIDRLDEEIRKIIFEDIKIIRKKVSLQEALRIFKEHGYKEKTDLLETLDREDVDIYFADKIPFTFHGYLAPSTSYITDFKLQIYHPGIVVLFKIDEDKDLFLKKK